MNITIDRTPITEIHKHDEIVVTNEGQRVVGTVKNKLNFADGAAILFVQLPCGAEKLFGFERADAESMLRVR